MALLFSTSLYLSLSLSLSARRLPVHNFPMHSCLPRFSVWRVCFIIRVFSAEGFWCRLVLPTTPVHVIEEGSTLFITRCDGSISPCRTYMRILIVCECLFYNHQFSYTKHVPLYFKEITGMYKLLNIYLWWFDHFISISMYISLPFAAHRSPYSPTVSRLIFNTHYYLCIINGSSIPSHMVTDVRRWWVSGRYAFSKFNLYPATLWKSF